LVYVSGRICLMSLFYELVPFGSRRFSLCFLSESLGYFCQPFRKAQLVFEIATPHGANPLQ
jgi:hypothetical protein